ncbi:testican-1-like [Siniperca chuatsi]|uniref:testican-1-like n=1 Tax=Siniperca chuatsi TaxID=119488 RepID=UPI001CE03440|nr:testican-1-like [Siniperca chuatsi]
MLRAPKWLAAALYVCLSHQSSEAVFCVVRVKKVGDIKRIPKEKVCVIHDDQTAICTNDKQPTDSVKPRKGSLSHKHGLATGAHGKCRLWSELRSNPVCGSDGHTCSSKARCPFCFSSLKRSNACSL